MFNDVRFTDLPSYRDIFSVSNRISINKYTEFDIDITFNEQSLLRAAKWGLVDFCSLKIAGMADIVSSELLIAHHIVQSCSKVIINRYQIEKPMPKPIKKWSAQ